MSSFEKEDPIDLMKGLSPEMRVVIEHIFAAADDSKPITFKKEAEAPRISIDLYPNTPTTLPFHIDMAKLEPYDPHEFTYPVPLDTIAVTIKGARGGDIQGILQARTGHNPQEFPPYTYPAGKPFFHLDPDPETGLLIARNAPLSFSLALENVSGKEIFIQDASTGTNPKARTRMGMQFTLEYDRVRYLAASTFTPQSGEPGDPNADDTRGRLEVHRWFMPDAQAKGYRDPVAAAMQIPSELANRFFPRAPFTVVVHERLLAPAMQNETV